MSPHQVASLFADVLRQPTEAERRWAEYRRLLDEADEIATGNGYAAEAARRRSIRP